MYYGKIKTATSLFNVNLSFSPIIYILDLNILNQFSSNLQRMADERLFNLCFTDVIHYTGSL
jgi:hypothetical protein